MPEFICTVRNYNLRKFWNYAQICIVKFVKNKYSIAYFFLGRMPECCSIFMDTFDVSYLTFFPHLTLQSAYAYTNEAVWLNVDRSANFTVKSARIVFGGLSETVVSGRFAEVGNALSRHNIWLRFAEEIPSQILHLFQGLIMCAINSVTVSCNWNWKIPRWKRAGHQWSPSR